MENQVPKSSDSKRWLSTGFIAGGVTSVDADKHTLHGAVMIRPGEAMGHGVWIDHEFCQAVAAMSANGKSAQAGLKARFGHPNMCSDALGTFLGRWKNVAADDKGFVRGDLHLSSTASESPKGDLRKYVEELAAKEPDHFGASIVFSTDQEAMEKFYADHTVEVEEADSAGAVRKASRFQSPDPANVKNLPHARLSELHAADLVDDPAATDGMFSGAGGAALAAQMTEWLDLHPEAFAALKEPGIIGVLKRYGAEIESFIERYSASQAQPDEANPSPSAAEPAQDQTPPPAESGEQAAEVAKLTAQVSSLESSIAQLSAERGAAVQRAESAEASIKTLNAERDELAARVTKLESDKTGIVAELVEANGKLAALLQGQSPVSSVPAETIKAGTLMERARANKK